MVFIAKQDISVFKKGDEVPDKLAKVWDNMYVESPVEEKKSKPIEDSVSKPVTNSKPATNSSKSTSSSTTKKNK